MIRNSTIKIGGKELLVFRMFKEAVLLVKIIQVKIKIKTKVKFIIKN